MVRGVVRGEVLGALVVLGGGLVVSVGVVWVVVSTVVAVEDLDIKLLKRVLVCNRFHHGNLVVVLWVVVVLVVVLETTVVVVMVVVLVLVVVVVVVPVVLFRRLRRFLQDGFSVVVGTRFHHFLNKWFGI